MSGRRFTRHAFEPLSTHTQPASTVVALAISAIDHALAGFPLTAVDYRHLASWALERAATLDASSEASPSSQPTLPAAVGPAAGNVEEANADPRVTETTAAKVARANRRPAPERADLDEGTMTWMP